MPRGRKPNVDMEKYFIYFEATDGGMDTNKYAFKTGDDFNFGLFGWMSEKYGCEAEDTKLVEWAKVCEVGEYFEHRMGTCVRVEHLNE